VLYVGSTRLPRARRLLVLSPLCLLHARSLLWCSAFPISWLATFSAGAAAITLVMVFVIQHTQSREQLATQLKLDELIRALPQADDHLVHVEEAGRRTTRT